MERLGNKNAWIGKRRGGTFAMFHSKVLGMTRQHIHKQTTAPPSSLSLCARTQTHTVLIPFISRNTGEKACSVPRILQRLNWGKGAESTETSPDVLLCYVIQQMLTLIFSIPLWSPLQKKTEKGLCYAGIEEVQVSVLEVQRMQLIYEGILL